MYLYGCKKNTDYVVNLLKNMLTVSNIDKEFLVGMVVMFHIVFGVYTLKLICSSKINNSYN